MDLSIDAEDISIDLSMGDIGVSIDLSIVLMLRMFVDLSIDAIDVYR